MTHQQLVTELLQKLSFPGCRVWKNNTGVAKTFDDERTVRFGLVGSADITGIMRCNSGLGVRLEVECKVLHDELRTKQIYFKHMILALGGLYIEARNISDCVDEVKKFMHDH